MLPDVLEVSVDSGDSEACSPGEVRCKSLLESEKCTADKTTWLPQLCQPEETCVAEFGGCIPHICDPFSTRCTSDKTFRQCEASGIDFEDLICDEDSFCVEGQCLYGPCLGHVLIVLDTSGSMTPHWESVETSILTLIENNPKTRFGLMVFPGDSKCQVSKNLEISLRAHRAREAFSAYFDYHLPGSSTPLLAAMQRLGEQHSGIFDGQEGVVVVLSDGEDTCDKEHDDDTLPKALAEETQALASAGVKTYVIGYNYQGSTAQLDAIASHGGTGHETHIQAGNEAQLEDALKGIVNDIKLCL